MARKSIDSRMDRIYDALLPVGSMARREYELPDHLRELLETHRETVADIIDRAEKSDPGGAYAALIEGSLRLPNVPMVLRHALGLFDPPKLTIDMSDAEIASIWSLYSQAEVYCR